MVNAQDVIDIYNLLATIGIRAWLTGGWGIDALLGRQTRPHKDLDVLVLLDDILRVRRLMESRGYALKELWSENRPVLDSLGSQVDTAYVLRDQDGRELDLHAITLDDQGNGIPAWQAENFVFTSQDLSGAGQIDGVNVRCITPQCQVICHQGYELPEYQLRDLDELRKMIFKDGPESLVDP